MRVLDERVAGTLSRRHRMLEVEGLEYEARGDGGHSF
jgi:hypothetical protein